ncbi:MAG: modulated efflux pump with fused ATPase and integral rane subunit [Conexibacter sp.]|jgi:ABC-type multidrug transport system ATPase subunit/ABC-type multidrug transport system permease subunit|nr:modulated efflux pump with fused ATPase and integral rane subunit [Conexibacter sp.]MDX6730560.1 transport system ATP-binding/permease protein [Baekduia sp.]
MTEHPPPTARPDAGPDVRVGAIPATILHHGRRIALTADGLQIGRVPGNDIEIPSKAVSRHHARIVQVPEGFWIVDLGSRNGTLLNGERFYGESRWLANGDTVVVGGEPLRFLTGQETRFAASAPAMPTTHAIRFTGDRLTIGRDDGNDVVLDDPNVSRFHAEVLKEGGQIEVRDLQSRNGTRVNGQPVRRAVLQTGSEIGVGPYRLIFDGTDFVARAEHGALRLDAEGIAVEVKDKKILQPTMISIEPGELVAIIGESGAGKSTLLKALAGVNPPTEGVITVNGEPLAARLTDIGYLPQDEVVHPGLTVYEALDYAARLRLPQDTSKEEIETTVDRVLEELELEPHGNTRIGSLSGGQRKRVGLAAELLSQPSLLFLDEPTTGLDPGLEARMMGLLHDLAERSRAVVVVTHATKSLDACGKIVVMGRGGRLCFHGPPTEALDFFDAQTYDDIYAQLDRRPAEEWQAKLEQTGAAPAVPEHEPVPEPDAATKRRRGGFWAHTYVLTHRYVRLFTRDRRNLLILLLQVPLLALAIVGLFKLQVFKAGTDAGEAVKLLFLVVITVIWLGSIDAAREIIKEKSVFLREAAVGVKTGAYVLSKAIVLFTLAAVQTLLLTAIVLSFQPLHESRGTYLTVLALLILTSWAAVGMGLLMSAAVKTEDQATSFIPLVLVPQLFFGGSIVPVATMSAPLEALSNAVIARWSYAGFGSAIDLNARIAASPDYARVSRFGHDYFAIATGRVALALLVFIVVFFAGIRLLLRRDHA